MKNHVVSLELAKQLKEAGYPQESEFYWRHPVVDGKAKKNWILSGNADPNFSIKCCEGHDDTAAPLATELLEQLPKYIEIDFEKCVLLICPWSGTAWSVYYKTYDDIDKNKSGCKNSSSLPDALAMMYLYLKKEGL